MSNKLSKAKQIEKDFRKRVKEQRRIAAYKEKFGINPINQTTMKEDFERERYLRSLPEKGIIDTASKTLNKRKLSKKRKKELKNKEFFYLSKAWRELRYKALKKYGRQCLCCGAKPPSVVLHVDHIKPRSKYPELELNISNLQILCEDCNLGKSNKDSIDWRTK